MLLRRRYRLFVLCAVVILFMLYRVSQNSWETAQRFSPSVDSSNHRLQSSAGDIQSSGGGPVGQDRQSGQAVQVPPSHKDHGSVVSPQKGDDKEDKASNAGNNHPNELDNLLAKGDTGSSDQDSNGRAGKDDNDDVANIHWKNPPKASLTDLDPLDNVPIKVHWRPKVQHFPVSPGSIKALPPAKNSREIPKIQFDFREPEPVKARLRRLDRLSRVKVELKRAWSGYRKFAWMHDEVRPVSAKYRDPFCGWSATLIDALDTLWLAGLHEEFDEAARAVKKVDFTFASCDSIPVFETTIRFLGGLLGAIDVSGGLEGEYFFLLDKAVELGDLLMDVFDTPNRMPVLHYYWKPDYASQPHRAAVVSIAELGTLSMEFTRLAQLTGEGKYYDAVDRITDALVEMQQAGTAVPGLFPENIDASGCNRTATSLRDSMSKAAEAQLDSPELSEEPEGFVVGKIRQKRSGDGATKSSTRQSKRRRDDVSPKLKGPGDEVLKRSGPFASDGSTSEWDCVPQGLVPGSYRQEVYHIAGGQDSAYEYFQKQYLLLGGLEEKYKKLHIDSVEAIDKHLLYRPMIKDNRDILFPARLSTQGEPEKDAYMTYEITHLGCFLGGMYAMGGKLFGRDQDLETAAQLTDGCVWAYESTPSGIMPETAHIIPCPTLGRCEFNETLWWQGLDPSWEQRAQMVAEWEEQWGQGAEEKQANKPVGKRATIPVQGNTEGSDVGSGLPQALKDRLGWQKASQSEDEKPTRINSVLEANRLPPLPGQVPAQVPIPARPQTHEEHIKDFIDSYKYPPGITSVTGSFYILRPEAIESVFYMYRITGDPIWQDKGWEMFQATVHATRTEFANSAIQDVFDAEPKLKDEMESFWLAETLKYYYLLFSEPDVASLDEWVFNTEAHPFRRP